MLSALVYLLTNGLFFTLRLSGGGSFPKPLKPEEEKVYLERLAQGDMEARNVLIERNLRLCVRRCLTPREERVITMRYGLDDKPPRTRREIADMCGISRSYASAALNANEARTAKRLSGLRFVAGGLIHPVVWLVAIGVEGRF